MKGHFQESLEQLKKDIQKEVINNDRNNHSVHADSNIVLDMENKLSANKDERQSV